MKKVNKKEITEKKRKIKRTELPVGRKTKLVLLIYAILIFVTVWTLVLGYIFPKVSDFMWYSFYTRITQHFYHLFSDNDWSKLLLSLFMSLAFLTLIFGESVARNIKLKKKKKTQIIGVLRVFSIVVIGTFFLCSLMNIFGENTTMLDRYTMESVADKEYSVEDATELRYQLLNKMNDYAYYFSRNDEGEILYDGNYSELAINNLKNISRTYHFLKGVYPRGYRDISDNDLLNHGDYAGLTFALLNTVSIDTNMPVPETLITVTHEYCHAKGVSKEVEATFCSIVASIEAEDNLSKYTGYKEAYYYMDYALRRMGYKDDDYYQSWVDKCLTYGYAEYCAYNSGSNYKMITSNDRVFLESYYFKNYKNKDVLIKNVEVFKDLFNVKILFGDREVTYEEFVNYFTSDNYNENDYLVLEFNTDKVDARKLYEYLNVYIKAFEGFYADDMVDKEDYTEEEYINYYLSPFKKNDILDQNELDEYDYFKVIRLLLEYFDVKGIK